MAQAPATGGDQDSTTWSSHPINIRLSVPMFHRRFYVTLVAGQERRRHERRKAERSDHPLLTAGNVFFTLGLATLFTIMALAALIAQSAIIE